MRYRGVSVASFFAFSAAVILTAGCAAKSADKGAVVAVPTEGSGLQSIRDESKMPQAAREAAAREVRTAARNAQMQQQKQHPSPSPSGKGGKATP